MAHRTTAIVLGGGGARGAYEAGVVAGIADVLAGGEFAKPLFDVFCGTSVGAINAAYLAATAHRADHGTTGLISHWRELRLERHLRLDVRALLGQRLPSPHGASGRSFLNPSALEELIGQGTPWASLRRNVESGFIRGLVVAALDIASGRTTVFTDLQPKLDYPASRDPRRHHEAVHIGADHVLASAAIPLIFPPRRIGEGHFADGGLRFNTPLAPALRLGAERIVVIPLLTEKPAAPAARRIGPLFLMGKLLNALLLDPIGYDLQVLARFNRLVKLLEQTLTADEQTRVDEAMRAERGAPYRAVDTLVFRPSEDLGHLARERAEELGGSRTAWAVKQMARMEDVWEADLLSFVLFDGEHAGRLIELGRRDVRLRAGEVREFFRDT
ncbi:MAG: patatin-like phospholipase family protein [Myxococcota bacterium]